MNCYVLQSIMETIALFVALGLLSQFVSARPQEQGQQNQQSQQTPMTEERFFGGLGGGLGGLASQFLGGGLGQGLGGYGQGLGGGYGGPGGYYNGYPGGGFGGQGFGGPGFGGGFGRRPFGFGYRNSDEIDKANKEIEQAENAAGKTDSKAADNNQKQ